MMLGRRRREAEGGSRQPRGNVTLTCTDQKHAHMVDLLSSGYLKQRMRLVHLLEVGLQETASDTTTKHDMISGVRFVSEVRLIGVANGGMKNCGLRCTGLTSIHGRPQSQ